jgi:hypothetical protein
LIAAFVLGQFDGVKFSAGSTFGVFSAEPLAHEGVDQVVEMKAELGVHLPCPAPPAPPVE